MAVPAAPAQAADDTPPTARLQAIPDDHKNGRNLVLIFDGTNNTFESELTSLPLLFSFLSTDTRYQLAYYQTGIGTYTAGWSPSGLVQGFWRFLDSVAAWNLPEHVKGGYEYLCNYYQPGDRIFLFGFSRGAYTARALAGMCQQVGLLMPGNKESVDLAYDIYSRGANAKLSPEANVGLADAFHDMFSRTISIHFVGVWDTVASVGFLTPKTLPFSSGSSMVSHFRHCLALDEHRVRFIPQVWLSDDAANGDPNDKGLLVSGCEPTTKEVWFSGAHSNIGGGQTATDGDRSPRLSHLPLRWMIREAVEQGLLLDIEVVENSPLFTPFLTRAQKMFDAQDEQLSRYLDKFGPSFHRKMDPALCALIFVSTLPGEENTKAARAPRGDRLSLHIALDPKAKRITGMWSRIKQRLAALPWILMEWLPLKVIQWDVQGKPLHQGTVIHRGRGRTMPPNPVWHYSVRERMNATAADFIAQGQGQDNSSVPETVPYKPKARFLQEEGVHLWDDGGF
ncbi:hypothetical protein OIV83_003598 [Microbotryomycetes sp. JL201]|nr:hypothetical protein OIV83_003598 [Microbotryomycetes sp. JL201]